MCGEWALVKRVDKEMIKVQVKEKVKEKEDGKEMIAMFAALVLFIKILECQF